MQRVTQLQHLGSAEKLRGLSLVAAGLSRRVLKDNLCSYRSPGNFFSYRPMSPQFLKRSIRAGVG